MGLQSVSEYPLIAFQKQKRNRAINHKVAGSIPGRAKMTLCPWARHFTLLASGNVPVITVSRSG